MIDSRGNAVCKRINTAEVKGILHASNYGERTFAGICSKFIGQAVSILREFVQAPVRQNQPADVLLFVAHGRLRHSLMSDISQAIVRQLIDDLNGLRYDLEMRSREFGERVEDVASARAAIECLRLQLMEGGGRRSIESDGSRPESEVASREEVLNCGTFEGLYGTLLARDERGRPNIQHAFTVRSPAPHWLRKFFRMCKALNQCFREGGTLPVAGGDGTIDLGTVSGSNPLLLSTLEHYIEWETMGRVRFVGNVAAAE